MTGTKQPRSRRPDHRAEANVRPPLLGALCARFGLSRMEAVVAGGLADGLTYEEIAERCCISYHTVHSHVKAIHQKTEVTSNGKLLALIRREGWS